MPPLEPPIVRDRILLHLLDYTKHADAFDVPEAMTQTGIAEAVWIDVRHFLQYARPLLEDELLRERKAHVKGGRRKRKVYDLTESGKLAAYNLREALKEGEVRVRDEEGVRETAVAEVLAEAPGTVTLIDLLREHVHAGLIDLPRLAAAEVPPRVEMLSDAPEVREFVGRTEELALLSGREDRPRLFVVRGVAGIGKSTLAARICDQRRGEVHLFWRQVHVWDTPQSVLASLGTFLAALGKPGLRSVLSEGNADLAPQVLHDDLLDVEALLVFDDAHEAESEVVAFLRYLKDALAEAQGVRAFVLTRRRLGFYDRRDVRSGLVAELDLGGLTDAEVETLLEQTPPPDVLEFARHPLFLQLLRPALREGRHVAGLHDVRGFIEETIYAELSAGERRMMKLACLYKVPVPADALFLDEALSHDTVLGLRDRALLLSKGDAGVEAHDTVQEYFAQTLTPAEREELAAFAVDRLVAQADRLRDDDRLSDAVACLANALELNPSGAERLTVCEALGDGREAIGDVQGAEDAYRAGLATGGPPGVMARLRRKLGANLVPRGAIAEALEEIERGFEALGAITNVERGWLHLARCRASEWQEEFEEAREHAAAALEIFGVLGEERGAAEALHLLGFAEAVIPGGDPTRARAHLEEALSLAEELDDASLMAGIHYSLAHLLAFRLGLPEEGEKHLQAAEDLPGAFPDDFPLVKFLFLQGQFLLEFRQDYEGAADRFTKAKDLAHAQRSEGVVAFARWALALVAYYEGRYEEAMNRLGRMTDTIHEHGLPASAVEGLCKAAECALLAGDLERFREIVTTLEDPDLWEAVEAKPSLTRVVWGVDRVLQGRVEEGRSLLREAVEVAEDQFPLDQILPCLVFGALLTVLGEAGEANGYLQRARDLAEAFARTTELATMEERSVRFQRALQAAVDAGDVGP